MTAPTFRQRTTGAVALVVAATFLAAGPATADEEDPGLYGQDPQLEVELLAPICDGDVPYLEYAVNTDDGEATEATITWVNPTGDDVVQAGLPLSGRVLWPGAVVDDEGNPVDWPGWRLEGDEWVEGDEFDWVRPSVQVIIEVNPEASTSVSYPPSSPDCATNPPGNEPTPEDEDTPDATPVSNPGSGGGDSGEGLASTGASLGLFAAIAAALLAAGGLFVAWNRRSARTKE
ncbi:peptidase [Oerskovia flava]|uniref:peptidase n=1 Tax=Oerskovia flava TaxID=2986422 RepID=UPI00223F39DB|nr:peptidase [Oerskovia sp. JB1-3-2]